MTVPEAIEVFARGFSYTRSLSHPFEAVRHGPLWVLRDAPRTDGDYRLSEILVHGVPPGEAVRLIADLSPSRFALCAIEAVDADHKSIKLAYKEHGFRLLRREPLMIRELENWSPIRQDERVVRVRDASLADDVAKAAGRRQMLPEHLDRAEKELRLYAALVEGQPVGWVRSIAANEGARWVSNLYVVEGFRRQGIATALMNALLNDDQSEGGKQSVLLSSTAGAKLYPSLGYEQIGLLQLFMPVKKRRA